MENKKVVTENVTVRIKTYEDAVKETGRPEKPDFLNLSEDLREYFKAQYKAVVIAEALNEGWKADWSNSDQEKWLPWFRGLSSGGFVFYGTYYDYSFALAGTARAFALKHENWHVMQVNNS